MTPASLITLVNSTRVWVSCECVEQQRTRHEIKNGTHARESIDQRMQAYHTSGGYVEARIAKSRVATTIQSTREAIQGSHPPQRFPCFDSGDTMATEEWATLTRTKSRVMMMIRHTI